MTNTTAAKSAAPAPNSSKSSVRSSGVIEATSTVNCSAKRSTVTSRSERSPIERQAAASVLAHFADPRVGPGSSDGRPIWAAHTAHQLDEVADPSTVRAGPRGALDLTECACRMRCERDQRVHGFPRLHEHLCRGRHLRDRVLLAGGGVPNGLPG